MKIAKKFLSFTFLYVSFFCWLSINYVSYVFAQEDNVKANSEKAVFKENDATKSEKPIVIMPVNSKNIDSDQENIGRDAMAMILEITQSNILYQKNKSSANLAFEEQKFKVREKHSKEMKEYNESYNKKYLASLKRYQKMRGQHAGYSGVHSDYSDYLQQFITSTKR